MSASSPGDPPTMGPAASQAQPGTPSPSALPSLATPPGSGGEVPPGALPRGHLADSGPQQNKVIPKLPLPATPKARLAPALPVAKRIRPALPIARPTRKYPQLPVVGQAYVSYSSFTSDAGTSPAVHPDLSTAGTKPSELVSLTSEPVTVKEPAASQGASGAANEPSSITAGLGSLQASEAPQSRPRRTELEVRVLPDQSIDQREEEWAACKAYLLRAYDGDFYAVPNLKRAIRTDRDRFFEKLLSLPGSRKINFQEGILLKEAGALHCVSAKLVPAGALKVELPKRGVKPEVVEALTRDVSDPPRQVGRAVPDVGIRVEEIELEPDEFPPAEGNTPVVLTRLHMKDGCYFLARDVKKLLGPGSESGNHALLSRLQRSDGSKGTRKSTMEEFRFLALRLGLKGGLPLLVAAACLQPVLKLRQVPEDIIERLTSNVDMDAGATAHRRNSVSTSVTPRRDPRVAAIEDGRGKQLGIELETVTLPMDETFSPDPIEVTRIFMRDGCFYLARDVKKLLGPGSESGNHALLRRAIQLDEAGATRRATKAEFQYLSSVLGLAGGVPTLVASTAVEPALRTRSVPLHIIRFLMDVRPPEGLAQAPPGGPAPGPAARPNILPQSRVTWGQGDNLVHLLAQPSLQQFAMEPLMGPGGPPSPVMPSPQLSVDRIWLPGVAPDGSSVPHVHKLDRVVLPDGCFFIGSKLVKALADSGYGIRMRNLEKSLRPDGTPGCREPSKELCNEMMRAGIQIHRGRRLPQLVAANALRPVLLQRLVHNDVVDLLEGCSVAGPPETAAEPLDGDQEATSGTSGSQSRPPDSEGSCSEELRSPPSGADDGASHLAEAALQHGGELDREQLSVVVRGKEPAHGPQGPTPAPGGEGASQGATFKALGDQSGGPVSSATPLLTDSGPGSTSLEVEGGSIVENPGAGPVGFDWAGMQNVFKVHAKAPDAMAGLPRVSHGAAEDGSSGGERVSHAPPGGAAATAGDSNLHRARSSQPWPFVPTKGSISTLAPSTPREIPGSLAVPTEGATVDGAAPAYEARRPSSDVQPEHWYPQGASSPLRNRAAGQEASQKESNSSLAANEEEAAERDVNTNGGGQVGNEKALEVYHAGQGGTSDGSLKDGAAQGLSLTMIKTEDPVTSPQPSQLDGGSLARSVIWGRPAADIVPQVGEKRRLGGEGSDDIKPELEPILPDPKRLRELPAAE